MSIALDPTRIIQTKAEHNKKMKSISQHVTVFSAYFNAVTGMVAFNCYVAFLKKSQAV